MGKDTLIKNTVKEGKRVKGGQNNPPSSARPSPPKGQKKKLIDFPNLEPQDRSLYMLAAQLHQNAFSLPHRARLADAAGQSFGGDRDLYNALGYSKNPSFNTYYSRYKRGDIAKRIISAFPNATWRSAPEVMENEDPTETEFEKLWDAIVEDFNVFHFLRRIDVLAGIGQYGVLLIGFDDGKELVEPVENAKGLLYLRPFMENHAEIEKLVDDPTDQRFGLPEIYKIALKTTKGIEGATTDNKRVHHSRILHVAEDLIEDDVHAIPRLEPILNRLHDLDLISGGSAEMFWRGGFPGYAFNIPADISGANIDTDSMKGEIENYVHDLKRYMRLQGVEVQSLSQQVADPSNNFEVIVRIISATTGIPARVLTGSERGQLASEQDETNWNNRVEERTQVYAEPMILRPFINKLIDAQVLPEVEQYIVNWKSMFELDEKDEALVSKGKAETLAAYVNAQGADVIVPPDMFRKKYLGFTDEENKIADKFMEDALAKEEEEVNKEHEEGREQEEWQRGDTEAERDAKYNGGE